MTPPRYYRGVPEWLWVSLAILAGLVVFVLMARWSITAAEERGRASAFADAKAEAELVWPAERATWARQYDSLAQLTRQRDTVLETRLAVVHDTMWLPADTTPAVRYAACRAELEGLADECAAFRVSATAALARGDSLRVADSLKAVGLILGQVETASALRRVERERDRRPTWGTTVQACTVTGAVAFVGGVLLGATR